MGKPTGFMEYDRVDSEAFDPKERIKNFNEFHTPLSPEKQLAIVWGSRFASVINWL